MKAAVFESAGKPLAIERIADPVPGERDLVLRVRACGICGSDLHLSNLHDGSGGMKPLCRGDVMGHEFCGEVVGAGSAVRGLWPDGMRVTALPGMSCGGCAACLAGFPHRCRHSVPVGLGAAPGGYAEYVRVSASNAVALPDKVDDLQGAMVEPLAVALRAVDRARLARGETVLVLGAGPIGLATAMWCRFFGARHVVVSDPEPSRLARAPGVGATGCIDPRSGEVPAQFKEIAKERPSVVFDCVGEPGSQQHAIDCAPVDGRVVVVGVCMERDEVLPVKALTKELQLIYTLCYQRRDFEFTVDMLAAGRIDPMPMLSSTVGFDGFAQAFDGLKQSKKECKVLLLPGKS